MQLTPEQQQNLLKIQQFTKKIRYVIHTDDNENRVEVSLLTDDAEAAQILPQVRETLVSGIVQTLYNFYGMEGERV